MFDSLEEALREPDLADAPNSIEEKAEKIKVAFMVVQMMTANLEKIKERKEYSYHRCINK